MQAYCAGSVPILREATRWPISWPVSDGGNNIDYDRLRQLVQERLPKHKSPRSVSMEATNKRNPDLVRNLLEGTDSAFPNVVGLCNVLGIPLSAVIKGADLEERPSKEWLVVNAHVQAGNWREQFEWSGGEWYEVEIDAHNDARVRYGVVVRGRSMDKRFPEGTVLECVDLITGGMDYGSGDYVIVERTRAGLREITCKKLSQRADGAWELIAESYLDEFQEPIFIGRPTEEAGFDAMDANETRVRAVVIDAHLPMPRRRTRQFAD